MCELESMSPVDEAWRIPDSLWQRIEPLLSQNRPHSKGGRPYIPARQGMDGIFYVLRTGCHWKPLPEGFAAAGTVHLRFQQWRAAGVFERLWQEGLIESEPATAWTGSGKPCIERGRNGWMRPCCISPAPRLLSAPPELLDRL